MYGAFPLCVQPGNPFLSEVVSLSSLKPGGTEQALAFGRVLIPVPVTLPAGAEGAEYRDFNGMRLHHGFKMEMNVML